MSSRVLLWLQRLRAPAISGSAMGPLVVTPLLQHGYHQALLLAALVVLAAAAAAGILRIGFPHLLPAASQPTDQPGLGPAGLSAARERASGGGG
jgi:hypothetical protein